MDSSVDRYLAEAPSPHRATLEVIRATLRELLPDAVEELSYGMPSFNVGGKAVAGYAYFKNHCSYFPHSGSVLPELGDDLNGYEWSKGTLKFPIDEPLPRPLLERLVGTRLDELGLTR
jgi:uncharacterized protein YdhG (YjbR/CyaY superfamily)